MLNFLIPKSKVRAYRAEKIPIEEFEIYGISQINPYCKKTYNDEVFVTIVNIANESKEYDEKEGRILTTYFSKRQCPRCKKQYLIPVEIRINKSGYYTKNEARYAQESYYNSRYHFPTYIRAYCNHCSTCVKYIVKNDDMWLKEARKIKDKDLIGFCWDEYQLD